MKTQTRIGTMALILALVAAMPAAGATLTYKTGLLTWLQADDLDGDGITTDNPANGTAVATWEDSHTSNKDATQATGTKQPLYRTTGGPNNMPMVEFDGASSNGDFMQWPQLTYSTENWTVFIVGRIPTGASANQVAFSDYGTSGTGYPAVNLYRIGTTTPATFSPYARSADKNAWIYVNSSDDWTQHAIRMAWVKNDAMNYQLTDGAGTSTGAGTADTGFGNSPMNADNPPTIGALATGASAWANLQVCEFLLYSSTLSDTDRAQVESYLKAKYFPPTVAITATTPNAAEQGPQAGLFTVNRGSRTDGALTVNFTLASGGANAAPGAANDYTLTGGTGFTWDGAYSGSVTIPNGAVNATITVTPVDDASTDPNETVIPTLASGDYIIGSPANATVTILDNEGANQAPVVSAGADQTVLNSALPIGATLNGSVLDDGQPTPVILTKTWSQVSVVPPGGTATFTDDHDPGTTVSFDQEGVYVLQLLGNDSALQANDQVTISAYKRQVSVAVQDDTARATQSPTDTATFRVSRPVTCTNEDLVVNYTLGGTAVSPADYTIAPASGSVIIPQGATDGDIVVTPLWKQDGAKTVVLTLTAGPVLAPYEITGVNPPPACTLAKVTGLNRYWVAATPGNWSDTVNWSDESGGTGGSSVPGNTGVAFFDGGTDGTKDGDCSVNAAVNVLGVNIGAGYNGTITQGAVTITVGNTGWTQAGGTFTGSASAITLAGTTAGLSLTGGSFTAGAGQAITLSGTSANFDVSGGTFNPSTSTVRFTGGGSASDNSNLSTGPNSLYNCVFAKGSFGNVTASGTVTISGKLTLTSGHRLTGNFNVAGDVDTASSVLDNQNTSTITLNGTGSQTISNTGGSGRLPGIIISKSSGVTYLVGVLTIIGVNSPFTQTAGSLDAGTSTLIFAGGGNAADLSNLTVTDPLYNMTQNKGGTGATYGRLNVVGSVTVNNNLAITGGHGLLGTIYVKGNVSHSAFNSGSTAAITLNGTGDQTISNTSGTFPSGTLTINKASGTVTLGSNVSLSTAGQDLIWTSGGLDLATYTLTVADDVTIAAGATTLGVTVADSTTAGRLTCTDVLTGIASAGLAVTVTATEAQVQGQTYTILINNTALGAQFESVTWGQWKGSVAYTDNSGKNVTLSGIYVKEGSVFRFR